MSTISSQGNSTRTIQLPAIIYGPIRKSIGYVVHVIQAGGLYQVDLIERLEISSRVEVEVYRLSNGQKIIVTTRSKVDNPGTVDGVIRIMPDGSTKWLSHKLLDTFKNEVNSKGLGATAKEIIQSWSGQFVFQKEIRDQDNNILVKGLRPPQIGGLHAIGSHWSLYQQAATIVMPTGTGKTETMLASLVAYSIENLLVVVPSQILRKQTAKKFMTLGLLRDLGNLLGIARNPIVGIIDKRPKSIEDLSIFDECNVVVSTMTALSDQSAISFSNEIAEKVSTLIVDEAHHIGANGWSNFREYFKDKRVLQFTATPYRRDGKLVDGKVVYTYPLHLAQQHGYFKKISFEAVYEIDKDSADQTIAEKAVEKLRSDLSTGKDHIIMARCANIDRASEILEIYRTIASDLEPVIIHSESGDSDEALEKVYSRRSRIVVCVNMLGEGFDLPQLKIAALHDTHKSLAILLQFTGRFTRTSGDDIGDATVVANIVNDEVSDGLNRLYSEDADWNELLSEFSSEAARAHSQLIEFLNNSRRLGEPVEEEKIEISHHLLRPIFTTLMYNATNFLPEKFFEGISKEVQVHRVWLHQESHTLYYVTKREPNIRWTRTKNIRDRVWDLHVFHFEPEQNLLYVSSSDKESFHEKIAEAIGAGNMIYGDTIFRSLGNINRLIFQNVGVKKYGRRNLRFALYTGSDVAEALSMTERSNSIKSNLSGTGWENGKPVTIGCSYKGRVWAREPGSIPELIEWCKAVGRKIKDESINTTDIIANVLIPEEVNSLPDKKVLSIEWPVELLRQSEERVILKKGTDAFTISMFDLEVSNYDIENNEVVFCLKKDKTDIWAKLKLSIGGDDGFSVNNITGSTIKIRVGIIDTTIERFLSDYPPLIRFIDLSELDGNLFIKPQHTQELVFPAERFEVWDWNGVDLTKESIWKDGSSREDSIQWKASRQFIDGHFEVVFDDDSAGEAADLVCLKEEPEYIRLSLVHCKFTKGQTAGERIKDVVEVSAQAIRSAKWRWKFKDLCRHILDREKRLANDIRSTRFLAGNKSDINRFAKISRFKEIRPEIVIVQPGVSKTNHTPDQIAVLAAAYSYLKETVGVDLDIICSE